MTITLGVLSAGAAGMQEGVRQDMWCLGWSWTVVGLDCSQPHCFLWRRRRRGKMDPRGLRGFIPRGLRGLYPKGSKGFEKPTPPMREILVRARGPL